MEYMQRRSVVALIFYISQTIITSHRQRICMWQSQRPQNHGDVHDYGKTSDRLNRTHTGRALCESGQANTVEFRKEVYVP